MIIKNRNLKVNKVVAELRRFLGEDGITNVQKLCVYIVCHDSDGDVAVITAYNPVFPIPKEGDTWTLPDVGGIDILQ